MDLKEKVTAALARSLNVEAIELDDDDDGLSGYVVSSEFQGVSSLDRQTRIYRALRTPETKLTQRELQRVLGVAALSPAEYRAMGLDAGHRVKVSRVKKTAHPGQPSRNPSKDKP